MRYFVDTEFLENGPDHPIHLLSLGAVAEDGREYYSVSSECPVEQANEFVRKRVLPGLLRELEQHPELRKPRQQIKTEFFKFVQTGGGIPEFVVYYGSYDWVVLCQLFGRMVDLPKGWPMYPFDIKQWKEELAVKHLPSVGKGEHHALTDARWTKGAWEFLLDIERKQRLRS